MIALGVIVDKDLRNTVLLSAALHAFCLALLGFSFVDKLNFSMDLDVDFLGPILKQADILVSPQEKQDLLSKKTAMDFFLRDRADLSESDFHLAANKPYRSSSGLFLDKKISAKNSYLFMKSETKQVVESVEKPLGWDKGLKLKIE